MQSRKALILVFKLFLYLFSIMLCAVSCLGESDLALAFTGCCFLARFGRSDPTSHSGSGDETDSELIGDKVRAGVAAA